MKKNINILITLLIALTSINIIRMLKLTGICCIFLSILSPLFFGYIIAWIIKPLVDKIKFNRIILTIIVYILFLGVISILLLNIIPQIIKESKSIYPIIKYYITHNRILYKICETINIESIMSTLMKNTNNCLNNIISILMNIVYSFIFGFFFLISKTRKSYFRFIPYNLRKNINRDLRLYLKSIAIDTLFMFITFSIIFSIIGLSSPILFALFCAITNIIPYFGPYIGGIPAIIIGLSNSFKLGIIVTITIIVVQTIENSIIQPLIVSKNVDLNPILILIGVIIFSHFFGILGMIISTPIVLVLKNIYSYYKKNKPKWFNLILDKL